MCFHSAALLKQQTHLVHTHHSHHTTQHNTVNSNCFYPQGVCTDGTEIHLGTLDEQLTRMSENELKSRHMLKFHPTWASFLGHTTADWPVLLPSLVRGFPLKFVSNFEHIPQDSVKSVKTLVLNTGPFDISNTYIYFVSLVSPLTTLLRYYHQHMLPPLYVTDSQSDTDVVLVNTHLDINLAARPASPASVEDWAWQIVNAVFDKYSYIPKTNVYWYGNEAARGGKKWICGEQGIVLGNTEVAVPGVFAPPLLFFAPLPSSPPLQLHLLLLLLLMLLLMMLLLGNDSHSLTHSLTNTRIQACTCRETEAHQTHGPSD